MSHGSNAHSTLAIVSFQISSSKSAIDSVKRTCGKQLTIAERRKLESEIGDLHALFAWLAEDLGLDRDAIAERGVERGRTLRGEAKETGS